MNGAALSQYGGNAYKRGDYRQAAHYFQKAVYDQPHNVRYHAKLADSLAQLGQTSRSQAYYQKALAIDPTYQPAYHGLGELLVRQGRVNEAQSLMTRWVGVQPYLPNAHIETAWMKKSLGDYQGAESSLRQALRIQPDHPIALAQMGQLYEDRGLNQHAINFYRTSLRSDLNQPVVKQHLTALLEPAPMKSPTIQQSSARMYPTLIPYRSDYPSQQIAWRSNSSTQTAQISSSPTGTISDNHLSAIPMASLPPLEPVPQNRAFVQHVAHTPSTSSVWPPSGILQASSIQHPSTDADSLPIIIDPASSPQEVSEKNLLTEFYTSSDGQEWKLPVEESEPSVGSTVLPEKRNTAKLLPQSTSPVEDNVTPF